MELTLEQRGGHSGPLTVGESLLRSCEQLSLKLDEAVQHARVARDDMLLYIQVRPPN